MMLLFAVIGLLSSASGSVFSSQSNSENGVLACEFDTDCTFAYLGDKSLGGEGTLKQRAEDIIMLTRTTIVYVTESKSTSHSPTGSFKVVTTPASNTPLVCNQDNCLRQLIQESPTAASFCVTYTKLVSTVTTGLPDIVSQCKYDPTRVSSACSCLATMTFSSTIPSVTHTSQMSTSQSSSHVSEDTCTTSKKTSAPSRLSTSYVSNKTSWKSTKAATSSTADKTTTGTFTSSSLVSTYSIFSTSISIPERTSSTASSTVSKETISLSSLPSSLAASSTASIKTVSTSSDSVSTTSTLAAPVVSTWVTLPPSDAMIACAASTECTSAGSLWDGCLTLENGLDVWDCLCTANHDEWFETVAACTACVMAALPPTINGSSTQWMTNPATGVPYVQTLYCNITDPTVKTRYKSFQLGQLIAQTFESPIEFFNMTLVDQPIVLGQMDPPAISVSLSAANSATISLPTSSSSSQASFSNTSPTTTIQSVALSSSTSSGIKLQTTVQVSSSQVTASSTAPSQTAQPESAFPISPQMEACEFSKTSCEQASMLFQECVHNEDLPANVTAWNCLCNTNFEQWNSTLMECSECISKALPPNITNAHWNASQVPMYIGLTIQSYCTLPVDQRAGSVSVMMRAGRVLTSAFQSPILWFNMTAIPAPLEFPSGNAPS
ncbi:uncharacterized protein LY89DRAFT_741292 [Mollisia scopiformis]|uniref:Uncharacterized protein n=1 Tax=Mollisia scopiformis TaxID=149040 RepID=A0A132B9A8_MOLSC|nr:uncharacterized protein LY89DRAFT_741292 [Mollisia scopiformis]KUJ08992.1 hypothetical protein LY89DRAFT_741292 [Mollisia scopiformis]